MGELNPTDIAGGDRPSLPTMFARGAVKHCPRCGLHFEGRPEEGHMLGGMTINIGLTAGTLILGMFIYIVVLATSDGGGPPLWFVVATSAALAVILPLLFYPFTKTIWVAAEIWMSRFDSGR